MVTQLGENEQHEVHAICNGCSKQFGLRVLKKEVANIKCAICESSDVRIVSNEPVRQILME